MIIRHSIESDVPRIMEIYAFSRAFMAAHGNPNQWGPNQWPPEALIREDIREGHSYVCLNDAGKVAGAFFFVQGPDVEPTYRKITGGRGRTIPPTAWCTASPGTGRRRASVRSA